MSKQTCKAARWVAPDVPPLFTEVVDIPHRAAEPQQRQRGKEGFSDSRLTFSGSCGQKQDSEEETSQWITSGSPVDVSLSVVMGGFLWLVIIQELSDHRRTVTWCLWITVV